MAPFQHSATCHQSSSSCQQRDQVHTTPVIVTLNAVNFVQNSQIPSVLRINTENPQIMFHCSVSKFLSFQSTTLAFIESIVYIPNSHMAIHRTHFLDKSSRTTLHKCSFGLLTDLKLLTKFTMFSMITLFTIITKFTIVT